MTARLFCRTGQLAGADYDIADEATIGKGAENMIQLYPTLISGKHARIFFDKKANCYMLEDLRSRNGTRLDGMRVTRKERLSGLHVITFANAFDFIFQTVEEGATLEEVRKPATPQPKVEQRRKTEVADEFTPIPVINPPKESPQPTAARERKTEVADDFAPLPFMKDEKEKKGEQPSSGKTMLDDAMVPMPSIPGAGVSTQKSGVTEQVSASVTFVLEFQNLKSGKQSFTLKDGPNTIGRDPSCQIIIEDTSLSRNHALITVNAGKATIKDLGSKNHTFVGDKKVTQEVEVRPGAEITFGLVRAVLVQSR